MLDLFRSEYHGMSVVKQVCTAVIREELSLLTLFYVFILRALFLLMRTFSLRRHKPPYKSQQLYILPIKDAFILQTGDPGASH